MPPEEMAGIYQNQNWMKDLPQGLMASLTNSQTGTADKKSMKLRDRFDQRNRIAIKIQKDAEAKMKSRKKKIEKNQDECRKKEAEHKFNQGRRGWNKTKMSVDGERQKQK